MAAQFPNTPFDGQRSSSELGDLLSGTRGARLVRRAEFLAAHPDHFACAVAGCEGLVGPDYIRGYDAAGKPWGLCPRAAIHSILDPRNFPPRRQGIRRSLPAEWADDNRMDAAEPEPPAKSRNGNEAVTA